MADERDVRVLVGAGDQRFETRPPETADGWKDQSVETIPIAADAAPERTTTLAMQRRWWGVTFSALVVLASIATVVWLVINVDSDQVLSADEPGEAPFVAADPNPSLASSNDDPFDELRHLPAERVHNLRLQSIIASPAATPLATHVRTRNDQLTGVLFLDLVDEPFVVPLGADHVRSLTIGGSPAIRLGIGSAQGFVVEWPSDGGGWLRLWGMGVTGLELEELAAELDATETVSGWDLLDQASTSASAPIWRAFHLSAGGEVAVVAAMRTDAAAPAGVLSSCADGQCELATSTVDEDAVEIVVFASSQRIDGFSGVLRPFAATSRRVLDHEFHPLRPVELDDDDVAPLLYLPAGDAWRTSAIEAHFSGASVREPALVIVQRQTPELGRITSALAMHLYPYGAFPTGTEVTETWFSSRVLYLADRTVVIDAWNHTVEELDILEGLIDIDGEGFSYASRALRSSGIEKVYDATTVRDMPTTMTEGVVVAAEFESDDGDSISMRVHHVASFDPRLDATQRRDNSVVETTVGEHNASTVTVDGMTELRWEPSPGVLITLSGTSLQQLQDLASDLRITQAGDATAATD